jgi:hypothetical protein
MNCTEVRDAIGVYLDGEFAEPERRSVEEHLRYCGACRQQFDGEQRFLAALRRGLTAGLTPATPELRQRLESVLQLDQPVGLPWLRLFPAFATAAAVVAVVGFFALRSHPDQPRDPLEFRGTSLATQEFVNQNFPYAVRLPLDEDADTRLVGAKLVRHAGTPAVVFMYQVQGREVAVLQRPEDLPGTLHDGQPSSVHAVPVNFVMPR